MIWETWLESAALGLSVSTTQAGIILSFIFTIAILLLVSMATGGRRIEVTAPLSCIFGVLFFVYIGWFPSLLGTMLALIMAILVGRNILGG